MVRDAIRSTVRYLLSWPYRLIIVTQRQVNHRSGPLVRSRSCRCLPRGYWRRAERNGCWCGFALNGCHTIAVIRNFDQILVAVVVVSTVAVFPWWRWSLVGRPVPVGFDGHLICVPYFAQNLFDVLIYSKTFVRYRLVANRARPCWCLFL